MIDARPLPEITPLTQPFWSAARDRRLVVQRCDDCEALRFPPEPGCYQCGSLRSSWVPMSGRATLWSWTVCHPPLLPYFAERNPWPVAVVQLEEGPRMVTNVVDVSIAVDDTLVKGVESWAWYGRQPIWKPVRENGFLLVTSEKTAGEVLAQTDAAERPYTLGIVPGGASFAGLWVYKDDHTDYRVLGAIAKVAPLWLSLENAKATALELAKNDRSAIASVQQGYDATAMRKVKVGEGTKGHEHLQFTKPGWTTMRPGIIVEARKPGERNPYYKKYGARTMRPVVNFDTCIKCTMCWLDCPDECFEVTPEGHYEVVYSACIGCGICAQVCPVKDCIVMVDELKFTDNQDKWQLWKQDRPAYNTWFEQMSGVSADPKAANVPRAGAVATRPGAPPPRAPAPAAGGDE